MKLLPELRRREKPKVEDLQPRNTEKVDLVRESFRWFFFLGVFFEIVNLEMSGEKITAAVWQIETMEST